VRLVALTCARSEDWILGVSMRVALEWVDAVVLLDHRSEDSTQAIAHDLLSEHGPDRVRYLRRDDDVWPEMAHRQLMLEVAREMGATHLALIDADEIVTANWLPDLRTAVERLSPLETLALWMVPVWGDARHFRDDDSIWSHAYLTLAVGEDPGLAWQDREDGYCHHARAPRGAKPAAQLGDRTSGGVMHFQFLNRRRLLAKHVWYRMIEHLRWPGRQTPDQLNAKYDAALNEAGMRLSELPSPWLDVYRPLLDRHLNLDATPWYEGAISDLLATHGRSYFAGLDLKCF